MAISVHAVKRYKQFRINLRFLKRHGYELKSSAIGWWVDGACGYLVAGYYQSGHQAARKAVAAINKAATDNEYPSWRFR